MPSTAQTPERARSGVLIKFKESELAGIDRVAAGMGLKRTTAIKRFMAAVVKRYDAEASTEEQ